MAKKPEIPQDEIDLGTLFSQIGKMFSSFFTFLGGILKSVFHYLIMLLIFIKKHTVKLGIAAILGAVIGYFVETMSPDIYHYDMIVEPHYDAVYQANERVQYYNDLIKNKDSVKLSKLFNIDYTDANSLVEFELRRLEEKRDILEAYDDFIKDKDSLTVANTKYEEFASEKFSFFDAKKYVFRMSLHNEYLKRDIQGDLIKDLENNNYLIKKRELTLARLTTKEDNLLKSIRDIDSLRSTYKEVALLTAKNQSNQGTAIDISETKKSNDNDVRLFGVYKDAFRNLDTLLVEKQKMKDIIGVVTPLREMGIAQERIIERKTVQLSLVFFGLMLLYILVKDLNKYLDSYKAS